MRSGLVYVAGFGVLNLDIGVRGLGFRVSGFGLRVWVLGFGSTCHAQCFGSCCRVRLLSLGFGDEGLDSRV